MYSYSEWSELISYPGAAEVDGIKLKEAGAGHWLYNDNATNKTGFNALPGGCRFLLQIVISSGIEYG